MSIADDMTSGVACEYDGVYLECEECEQAGIPAYCDNACADARGAPRTMVCRHKRSEPEQEL